MKFEFDNNIPIYIQLVEQLKICIISGNIELGSRLPSVRDFALEIRVNPNTIQKALSELEKMNLIYTERTNGKYVTNDRKLVEKLKYDYALQESKKYFSFMEKIGFDKKETIEYLKKIGGDK